MSAPTIDELRASLGQSWPATDPVYAAKQLHPVPAWPEVKREAFILERVTGKRVLEFGASGPMHDAIVKASAFCLGVDRDPAHMTGCGGDYCSHGCVTGFDLDDVSRQHVTGWKYSVRGSGMPEIIVCGEVLEHLGNPQWFLTRLRRQYPGVPVLITVPNAHSLAGTRQIQAKQIENCNRDHVAWYSARTLQTLLDRVGYVVREGAWYNGPPGLSEGLIVVVE